MTLRTAAAAVAILVCIGVVALPTVARDDATSTPPIGHPLVGAWVVTIEISMDGANEALFLFHSDGTVLATDVMGRTWYGSWVSTGPRSAKYTLVKSGPAATSATFSGTAEAEPSGNKWVRSTRITGGASTIGVRIAAE